MNGTQKKIFLAVAAIGLVYFAAFFFPNATGAQTEKMLFATGSDEAITYPTTLLMLTPAESLKHALAKFVYYGDYHYGYPFYFLSALTILPVRLVYGSLFTNHPQLNLLLLRQFISVLPMVAAVILLVYLQTRFKSTLASIGLLLLLLTTRGVFRNNLRWWHPDALAILAVVLVLFFLDRDRLRFGKNFFFAAAACGLATSIKLLGVFFAFAILAYLGAGLATRRIDIRRAVSAGALFTLCMLAVVVVTNPFLVNRGAREEMIKTQQIKTQELRFGYTHDDPTYYQKGPAWWEWTLRTWYGSWFVLGILLVSLVAGCLWGPQTFLNRLILLWVVPYSLYLFYFVAPKPDHYFLPAMLPLFSAAFALPEALKAALKGRWQARPQIAAIVTRTAAVLLVVFLAAMLVNNFVRPDTGITRLYPAAFQEIHPGG